MAACPQSNPHRDRRGRGAHARSLAAPGDLVVVLVDRVTLVWEALAQRAEHEASGQVVAGNGYSSTSDIPPPECRCPKRPGNAGGAEIAGIAGSATA